MKYCILFNPLAGNKDGYARAHKLETVYAGHELRFFNIIAISDYSEFFKLLYEDETLVLAGGDGTIAGFVNETENYRKDRRIWYYPTGTGNDFWKDLGYKIGDEPKDITDYLNNLPTLQISGTKEHFINGVGFGLDGYCCQAGDELRKTPGKKINYTAIAIKALLFHYRRTDATIMVDGKMSTFKHVWIAPTMFGRFYGGGMMAAPNQDRNSKKRTLTCVVMHSWSRLLTLVLFPGIFKGNHIKHKKHISVFEGREIRVRFNSPRPLQCDGETRLGVTEYIATCKDATP